MMKAKISKLVICAINIVTHLGYPVCSIITDIDNYKPYTIFTFIWK